MTRLRDQELYEFEDFPQKEIPFSWQPRDGQIVEKIHAFDGMLGLGQIARLFFRSNTGQSRAKQRVQVLISNKFLRRPNARTRKLWNDVPIFLAERGADWLAGNKGQTRKEMGWRQSPRWSLVPHDLKMNEFTLDLMEAVESHPRINLQQWFLSGHFWRDPDEMRLRGSKKQRQVKPDGYFWLDVTTSEGGVFDLRMLLEIDNDTETHVDIGRDKVRALTKYLTSTAFADRFGGIGNRILFVTTNETRARNMWREVVRVVKKENPKAAGAFLFTWEEAISPKTILTGDVWLQGKDEVRLVPLIPSKLLD